MRRAKLSLLPDPQAEETFGSWLGRCAVAHQCLGVEEFVAGVWKHADLTNGQCFEASGPRDWDTNPSKQLIQTLAATTSLEEDRLRKLVVRRIPSTLPPVQRDAYCGQCFVEDLASGPIYVRREWIDGWTIHCNRHQCLLGEYPITSVNLSLAPLLPTAKRLHRDKELRYGAYGIASVRDCLEGYSFRYTRSWPPAVSMKFLDDPKARSQLLQLGVKSSEAFVLFGEIGRARQDLSHWTDWTGQPLTALNARHPLAPVFHRVRTAYLLALYLDFGGSKYYLDRKVVRLAVERTFRVEGDARFWDRV